MANSLQVHGKNRVMHLPSNNKPSRCMIDIGIHVAEQGHKLYMAKDSLATVAVQLLEQAAGCKLALLR